MVVACSAMVASRSAVADDAADDAPDDAAGGAAGGVPGNTTAGETAGVDGILENGTAGKAASAAATDVFDTGGTAIFCF